MGALLKFSNAIDRMSGWIGKYVIWLILASTLISAINAVVRKVFNNSSNAFLEIQWYLFAASFLIGAGYTLLNNEHVKIDVVSGKFSKRTQIKIDVFGFVAFLIPVCLAVLWYGTPFFYKALISGEVSSNAGGLIRWPATLALPVGFAMVWLQGLSELIKRIAYLRGEYAMDTHYEKPLQ